MNDSTLPGCIGYFGKPISPNNCAKCHYIELCKKVVAKEKLQAILAKIEEIQAVLKGGKQDGRGY